MKELKEKAKEIRKKILEIVAETKEGHLASSLSIIEILMILYFKILNINPKKPKEPERDRFILSKGHASLALYAVLAEKGFFSPLLLDTFCQPRSILGSHPEREKIPGVEISTGSLGLGFSVGVGIALLGKIEKKNYRVFVLLGDGECQEGSIWEAALFASFHKLDNLTVIVDYNELQASGRIQDILDLEPFAAKWKAFNWKVKEIDGHDLEKIFLNLKAVPFEIGKPNLLLTHTIKGKGISFIEKDPSWHTRIPSKEELLCAFKELK